MPDRYGIVGVARIPDDMKWSCPPQNIAPDPGEVGVSGTVSGYPWTIRRKKGTRPLDLPMYGTWGAPREKRQ